MYLNIGQFTLINTLSTINKYILTMEEIGAVALSMTNVSLDAWLSTLHPFDASFENYLTLKFV